jgi:DNA-binding CsgD family transcriptional regulator
VGWELLSHRYIRLVRQTGALTDLPLALDRRARSLLFAGELTAVSALLDETRTVEEAIGSAPWPYGALGLAAFRGHEGSAAELIKALMQDATRRGEGLGITAAEWANAVLSNGLGRYEAAMAAAQRATAYHGDLGFSNWALVELVEAAVRSGMTEAAAGACRRLTAMTSIAGTDWALGLAARSRALLSKGDEADDRYREAIGRLGRTWLRVDLARAHLLYGEWLRREQRRRDAREQLGTAWEMLEAMGVGGFAERARRELQATGETPGRRASASGGAELTAQEAQIARLARAGCTNPEIGAQLFLSPRTVQYHLGKVFTKLGISSRSQLHQVLRD